MALRVHDRSPYSPVETSLRRMIALPGDGVRLLDSPGDVEVVPPVTTPGHTLLWLPDTSNLDQACGCGVCGEG
jgi:hypothetical protein